MKLKFLIKEGLTKAECTFYIGYMHLLRKYFKKSQERELSVEEDIERMGGMFFGVGLNCYIFLDRYEDTPRCNNVLSHEVNHFVKQIIKTCSLGQNEEIHSFMSGEIIEQFKLKYHYVCKQRILSQKKQKQSKQNQRTKR